MKLLLFSDVHENRKFCIELINLSREVDIVIGAGDFGSFRKGVKETIKLLSEIKKPAIIVPGNAESYAELKEACSVWPEAHVLHGSGITINDTQFFGLGGAVPVTPFGSWSYDFSEEDAQKLLKDCPEEGVLVSHSPPKNILDLSSRGVNLGSTAVREAIEMKRPRLVVCGHIHESSGQIEKIGLTTVVNAGPGGMLYELVSDSDNALEIE